MYTLTYQPSSILQLISQSQTAKSWQQKLGDQTQKCCVAVAKARKLCPAMLTCTTAEPVLDD